MLLFKRLFEGNKSNRMIASFEKVTLRESGMRYVVEYEIVMKEDRAEVSQYEISFAEKEARRILKKRMISDTDAVIKLLNDCALILWDGFHGSHPKGIKDGIMFILEATVNENTNVYAEGSQNFPKHYKEFKDGLKRLLNG